MDLNRTTLTAFDYQVRACALEIEAFGLAFHGADGYAEMCTRHRLGVAAHRMPARLLPSVLLRAKEAGTMVAPLDTLDASNGLWIDRLRGYGVGTLLGIPLRDGSGVFWTGKAGRRSFTPAEIGDFESLAERMAAAHRSPEPPESRRARLTRLEAVDRMLPVLGGVLDPREVFSRLAQIARAALAHDVATIQLMDDDFSHSRLYALDGVSSDVVPQVFASNYPAPFIAHFVYNIHDDLTANDVERQRPPAKAGMRSSVRVPLRFNGRTGGALELSAAMRGAFREVDVAIARRIADYVTVAIGHQQMADEAQRAAAAVERTESLLMLDQLLPALASVIDVRDVFDRVSEIAKQVIPHDALGLPLVTEDREHMLPFATAGVPAGIYPGTQRIPDSVRHLFTTPWDHEIFDDIDPARPGQATYARMGQKSVLRVPIRVEGQIDGALVFMSKERGTYSHSHVIVAKRIADHISLALSHQRLAEKARRNEELRARASRLELLDEVLTTVTGAGDLPDVFGRVSAVAQKILDHDALVLTAVNPDGVTARIYASQAPDTTRFPETVEVPPYMRDNPEWEHEIIDDLQARPDQQNLTAGRLGYRAALRMAIRLNGEYVAGVSFLSFTPGRYAPADILVARRIADRLALSFERERRAAASKRADEATARASHLESRVRQLTDELDGRTGYRRVVGQSAAWRSVLTMATQVASTETTVLLLGESGTGKEVIARYIHRASSRQDGPFIALNCAALPEQLLEAELFGYERGAFTGATQSKPGQLEQAAGGTLFLDEVGEMSLPAQAKFLRVLQEREFQRLGGTRVLRTDARIIAATNRDLERAIADGTFREDLFYRLNVFALNLPPIRERREDVLPLSEAFLAEYGRTLGSPPAGISRDARKLLLEYDWPGNVRELRNILERAAILCDGGLITAEHLSLGAPGAAPRAGSEPDEADLPAAVARVVDPQPVSAPPFTPPSTPPPGASSSAFGQAPGSGAAAGDLSAMERAMVVQALEKHRFNKSKAAKELGLTRAQLYVRMKRHGLE